MFGASKATILLLFFSLALAAQAFAFFPLTRDTSTGSALMSMSCKDGYPLQRRSRFGSGLVEMADMMNQVEQLFDSNVPSIITSSPTAASMMRMDIKESNQSYRIDLDLPGIAKEDVDISVEDRRLTITVKRTAPVSKEEEGEKFLRLERFSGETSRTMTLPDTADTSNIEAEMKNGVLHLKIPKVEEVDRTVKVEIK